MIGPKASDILKRLRLRFRVIRVVSLGSHRISFGKTSQIEGLSLIKVQVLL